MSYNFKKINELELINEVPEGANVLIEADGATKRLPSTAIKSDDSYSKEESDTRYLTKDSIATPDLAQNDPEAPDYVKGRTHYSEWSEVVSEMTVTTEPDGVCAYYGTEQFGFEIGMESYRVIFNSKEYICEGKDGYFGNEIIWGDGDDTGEPFLIEAGDWGIDLYTFEPMTFTIRIYKEVTKKLEEKYMPESYGYVATAFITNYDTGYFHCTNMEWFEALTCFSKNRPLNIIVFDDDKRAYSAAVRIELRGHEVNNTGHTDIVIVTYDGNYIWCPDNGIYREVAES